METLKAINALLREFQQQVERIVAPTKQEHDEQVNLAYASTMGKLRKLCRLFPDIMPIGGGTKMSADEVQNIISNLKRSVATKFSAPLLPSYNMLQKEVCGKKFNIPSFEAWQGASSEEANFVIHYNKATESDAISAMNYLVGNMLLSLPIKRVHLNFVDLNYSGAAALFTTKLDKSLFRDVIYTTQEFQEFCEEMQQRLGEAVQDLGGNLIKYNEENQTYRYPYEVVVLIGYPNQFDHTPQQLSSLFENGHKGGIYFVVMNNCDIQMPNHNNESLIDKNEHYTSLDLTASAAGQAKPVSCLEDKSLAKSLFKYINEEAAKKPEAKAVKANYQEMFKHPYYDIDSIIEVPVGEEPDGRKINFVMNAVDHIHCFILGQSGSGKSVFLHDIIAGTMLKYRPEDIQFYLLDFKLGGVEFNRYRDSKHVKALLVDNSDMRVTLEILKDLYEQMKERGKLLTSAGVTNISDYNRGRTDNRMPQILFVADECHAMFNTSLRKDGKMFREMSEIITLIAKEGRNQGVHLILATQTLAQTDISSEILNNISDRYLLICASGDSEKMIPESSEKTANLATGQVFYKFKSEAETVFQSYFTPKDEVQTLTKYIVDKAAGNLSNGQFYFNGSQIFELNDELIKSLPAKRNNVATIGCTFDLRQEPLTIPLKKDDGENILFFGINDKEQVTRTVMNALVSLVYTAKDNGRQLRTCVIDCLGKEDGDYLDVLEKLSGEGLISIISNKREIGCELHRIAKSVLEETATPTLLVILGQERIRGIRFDEEINLGGQEELAPIKDIGSALDNFSFDQSPGQKNVDISTYRKALAYILDNGPYCGVNTLLQLDVPSKLLYEDFVNAKSVFARFNHLVMLRTEEKAANTLGLSDDIHLEQLSSEPERLRAYYYTVDGDKYKMITPYVIK